jgi:transcriptional regulator with XRE-family HTH domain
LLTERKLLPAELAAKIMVPLSSLTRVLSGEVKNPGIDLVISLANGLQVSASELLDPFVADQCLIYEVPDRTGVLKSMLEVISGQYTTNIRRLIVTPQGDTARIVLTLDADDPEQIQRIGKDLDRVLQYFPGIRRVVHDTPAMAVAGVA